VVRDLNIVSLGLSQFNRETSKNYDDSPTVQGLMGGSPLENDSDQVFLIDHSRYERVDNTGGATQTLILGKNRHGPCVEFPARWDYNTLRIVEQGAPAKKEIAALREQHDEQEEVFSPLEAV
jgi:replicative DNA helicase